MAQIKTKQISDFVSASNTLITAGLSPVEASVNSIETILSAAAGDAASIDSLEGNVTSINTRVSTVESVNTAQDASINSIEVVLTAAAGDAASIDSLEGNVTSINTRVSTAESVNTVQSSAIVTLTTADTSLNTRVSTVESVNTVQSSAITGINVSIDSIETALGTKMQAMGLYGGAAAPTAASTPFVVTLDTAVKNAEASYVDMVTVNGLTLKYSATPADNTWNLASATTVTIQLAYAVDATDYIEVYYAR